MTAEFYHTFWAFLGELLVDSLNYSQNQGELSTSQKQAIIKLIEKKEKDRRFVSNWRPISLINVDTKIASKALAIRLKEVLPHIIHYNQNAYVKGRNISDATRSIKDIIDYTDNKKQGILTTIDFEKAFDSVSWFFMFSALDSFGFGESFKAWIKTFYTNISSCVSNNGFHSCYFDVKRGVRQGDPLSPYLFIIVSELLAIQIRQSQFIQGLSIGNHEVRVISFADDMTTFVTDSCY